MKRNVAVLVSPRASSALVALSLVALAPSCCDDSDNDGGGLGPPGGTVLIDFELRTDLELGNPLFGDAVLTDLNGDGQFDLVETGANEQRLSIGLGLGAGEVVSWQTLPTPGIPLRAVVADLDGSGRRDIVVLCLGGGAVVGQGAGPILLPAGGIGPAGAVGTDQRLAVYRDGGDGLYELRFTVPLEAPAFDMAAGPLVLGSAREQIVVPQLLLGEVWVFEELVSDDLLPVAVRSATGFSGELGPVTVTLIDAGGDGTQDIAVGLVSQFGSPGGASILRQDGALNFEDEVALPVLALLPIVRALGDVVGAAAEGGVGNGLADLAVADAHPAATEVFLLAGEADLLEAPLVLGNGGPSASAASADVDGDGLLDLCLTLFDSGGVSVRLAEGAGAFGAPRLYNVAQSPRGLQHLDVNGDGLDDVASVGGGGTSLLLALGDGRMRGAEGFFVGVNPQFVATADLDGDGLLDAVSIDAAQRDIGFLRGLGNREFAYAGSVPLAATEDETPGYFVIADLDDDGFPEVIASATQAGDVRVLRGGPTLPPALPGPGDSIPVGPTPRGLDLGDVDGDGALDVVVAVAGPTPAEGAVRVLRGEAGSLVPMAPITVPGTPLAVRLADLDGDGFLDLIAVNDEPRALLLRGDGAGGFVLTADVALTALALAIQVGDVVEDGRPDVIVGQSGLAVENLVLLENLGDFEFASRLVPVGVDPGTVELLDADGDARLDLVVPLGSGRLALLGGDGQGNFAPLETATGKPLGVPFGTRASTLADLDGDGRAELLMVSPATRQVWVARNASLGTSPE